MRLCGCGFANLDDAVSCAACGSALAGADAASRERVSETADAVGTHAGREPECERKPVADEPDRAGRDRRPALAFHDVRTGELVVATPPGGLLGRAGDFSPDAFSPRVSGVHAVVSCGETGRWTIEHLGRNGSSVQRAGTWLPLRTGEPQPLFGGEVVKLADMVFRVSVGKTPEANETTADQMRGEEGVGRRGGETEAPVGSIGQSGQDASSPLAWSVRCPVCGTEHAVDGPADRAAACSFCKDEFDRKRIARSQPRQIPQVEG